METDKKVASATAVQAAPDVEVGSVLNQSHAKVGLADDSAGGTQLINDSGHIYLIPTPTPDPSDPLHWSAARKWTICAYLVLWSSSVAGVQTALANFLPSVASVFPDATDSQINLLVSITSPLIAPGELLFVPLAIVYGRRLAVLSSMVLVIASCIWGACAYSYPSLLGARVIQGFAGGPCDAMVYTIVQDFTFIHERGTMLGVVMMGPLAFQLIFTVATNYMAVVAGFRWSFVFFALTSVWAFIGLFFCMPESRFDRGRLGEQPPMTSEEYPAFKAQLNANGEFPAYTLRRKLEIWVGKGTAEGESFRGIYGKIARMSADPTVLWVGLLNTVITGGLVAMSTLFATMAVTPPWNWKAQNVGLINLSAVVASVVDWTLFGWASDRLSIWMAKRNGGKSLPEHRLVTLLVPVAVGVAANIGFGALCQRYYITNPGGSQPHWFSLVFIYGIFYLAWGGILEVTFTYLAATTHPTNSLAAMTVVCVLRDMVSFGMSYGVVGFADHSGYMTSFGVYAMLVGFFGILAIPVYIINSRRSNRA